MKKRHYCTFCKRKRNSDQMRLINYKLLDKTAWICKNHVSTIADIIEVRDQVKKPVFLELFAGSKHISNAAAERGYETISVDIDKKLDPDIAIDIINLRRSMLPGSVDVVHASIPCQVYSILNLVNHWDKISIGYRQYYYVPKTQQALEALRILNKTISLIVKLKPIFYFIENPRGALRHFPQMKFIPFRHTVSYSDYGFDYYKPTDLWTNCKHFQPKTITGCVGKKFNRSVDEINSKFERSLLPPGLITYMLDSISFLEPSKN